ncbi:carbohydrate porin [Bradyrhizobium liaoningense]
MLDENILTMYGYTTQNVANSREPICRGNGIGWHGSHVIIWEEDDLNGAVGMPSAPAALGDRNFNGAALALPRLSLAQTCVGAMFGATLFCSPALAGDAGSTAASAAALDAVYGQKLWTSIRFPSFADTVTQDIGGWRTELAKYGFGFEAVTLGITQRNMLNTPRSVPASSYVPSLNANVPYPACSLTVRGICAGGQAYAGQKLFGEQTILTALTYDTSRWGVPDGQIMIMGNIVYSSFDDFLKNQTYSEMGLIWYQTLFNKAVEVRAGLVNFSTQFVGTYVASNLANTFGPGATIPVFMGFSFGDGVPGATFTWHVTPNIYEQFGVARSIVVNGPTKNPLLDEGLLNPSGFKFDAGGSRALVANEVGWKNAAAPGVPQNWLRVGGIYNFSDFADHSKLPGDTTATQRGGAAGYALYDRQLWQQAPTSAKTAYRGIYAGVSGMWADPAIVPISQYYEGRLYWMGPMDSRPTDMVSFIYAHNTASHYLANGTNAVTAPLYDQGFPVPVFNHFTNSYTVSYVAHLRPGVYVNVGVSYTDNPSLAKFKGEGAALSALASLTTAW